MSNSNSNSKGTNIEPHDKTKNADGSMNIIGLVRMLVLVLLVTIVALIILFILFGVINISTIRSVDESTRNTDVQLQEMIAYEVEDEKERQRLVKQFFGMIGNITENQKININNIQELERLLYNDTTLTLELKEIVTNNTKNIRILSNYLNNLTTVVQQNNQSLTLDNVHIKENLNATNKTVEKILPTISN